MTRLTLQDIGLLKTVNKFGLLYKVHVFQYPEERHNFYFTLLLFQVTLLEIDHFYVI